jgi:hypothetical protein
MGDPAAFVEEALQVTLHPWQTRILEGLTARPDRVTVVGVPHVHCGRFRWHGRHSFYRPAFGWMICRGER